MGIKDNTLILNCSINFENYREESSVIMKNKIEIKIFYTVPV
uniref:Uncharacterized protein n=1 Tax=Elizabethkingia anophelis TaxID=1117645 RepID=A0A455ZIF4_9FLAO|nr:TPA_exp: hypothetical protein [Elizabethkingia anophelis]